MKDKVQELIDILSEAARANRSLSGAVLMDAAMTLKAYKSGVEGIISLVRRPPQ